MLFSLVLAGASLVAASPPKGNKKSAFTNLVTFGDSFTDNGRLGYYINNAGKAPPPGQLHPESNNTASGGLTWAQYVAQSAGARLADYAIGGATCSNKIVEREFSYIGRSFPSVLEDEIPSFQADIKYKSVFTSRTEDNTVYALWIGTNDLGFDAFLSDSQAPGTTITNFVECVWSVFDAIYKTGGRRFVLLNEAPLERSPLYAPIEKGGTGDSQFWKTKSNYNTTQYSEKIKEYTTSVNTIFEYGVPFQQTIKSRWPKATFDLFDVHRLFLDIYKTPSKYLDAPYNVDSYWHQCDSAGGNCVDQTAVGPLSGYLWYDELHPSNKADSVIANNFIDVLDGKSKYGTRWQSK
ncbi:GDSL lipase/esterase [Podospora fimiseda]|uniref:GDSL lipase/esterase n=1 Tax=Podospora fimiseda TaxID=252190 RepID=A0AAN7BNW3_9PEZI|nr:GDSL lipase/esterase [Podospora fimiseda]